MAKQILSLDFDWSVPRHNLPTQNQFNFDWFVIEDAKFVLIYTGKTN